MRLFLFLLLITQSVIAQKINQTDDKGQKQGLWRKYHKNGRLDFEGEFKDGKPIGLFKYYYDNGTKKALIEHNITTSRSLANFFHPNGQMMSAGIYRNQMKDSTWVTFTETGLVSEISNYLNNELHGERTTYYISGLENASGRVIYSKSNYKNGKQDGEFIEYFMDGKKKLYSFYIEGNLNGMYIEYHRNGNKKSEIRYKNGVKHGYVRGYDETGKEIGKAYFYKGKLLEGKELEKHLNYCKTNGIDPNQ